MLMQGQVLILVVVVVATFAATVLGSWRKDPDIMAVTRLYGSEEYAHRRVVLFMSGVLNTLCVVCWVFVLPRVWQIYKYRPVPVSALVCGVGIPLFIIIAVYYYSARKNPGARGLGLFQVISAAVPAAGMWLVAAAVRNGKVLSGEKLRDAETVLALRANVDGFLLLLGIMLGVAILWIAALRNAHNATPVEGGSGRTDLFPRAYVVLFGLIFSFLLAVVYAPAYLALLDIGREARDGLLGSNVQEWIAGRKSVDELFGLQVTTLLTSGAVPVFLPLVTGVLSAVLSPKE